MMNDAGENDEREFEGCFILLTFMLRLFQYGTSTRQDTQHSAIVSQDHQQDINRTAVNGLLNRDL